MSYQGVLEDAVRRIHGVCESKGVFKRLQQMKEQNIPIKTVDEILKEYESQKDSVRQPFILTAMFADWGYVPEAAQAFLEYCQEQEEIDKFKNDVFGEQAARARLEEEEEMKALFKHAAWKEGKKKGWTDSECDAEGYKQYREWQNSKIETARASSMQRTKKMFNDMIKIQNLDGKVRSVPITSKKRTSYGADAASAEFYTSQISEPIVTDAAKSTKSKTNSDQPAQE